MLSKYRITNLFVNFNTTGKPAAKFRKALSRLGFMRFDVSTYFYSLISDNVDKIMAEISANVPRSMTVRVIRITDKQWTDAKIFIGKDK